MHPIKDRFCIHVLLFCILLYNGAAGSEDPNGPVLLEDYLRTAAMNNAGLQSSFEQWRSAMLAIEPAGALEDPRFTYGYFIEEIETRTGPQKHRLSLAQMFPWFGVLEARTDAAAAVARAARQRYEARRLELFQQTKYTFYEYSYLARAVRIAEQNLELLKYFEQVAQTRFRTATGTHPDIIRAQIELATLEDNVTSLLEMRKPITGELNAIMNRPKGLLLPWPVREKEQLISLDAERFFAELAQYNPELKAIEHEIAAARSRIELAEKRYYPNVTLGLDWIVTDEARAPGTFGSGKDPLIAMVSLNIPIWTDSYKSLENQAQAHVRQSRRERQQMEFDLAARLTQAVYQLNDSRRKTALYGDVLIPKAQEMVKASEEAYRAGNLDFLSLIDAQRKQLAFELAYERSLATHLQQQAVIEQLIGREIQLNGSE